MSFLTFWFILINILSNSGYFILLPTALQIDAVILKKNKNTFRIMMRNTGMKEKPCKSPRAPLRKTAVKTFSNHLITID